MKTISQKTLPNGRRRVTVELVPGEELLPIRADSHYKLGHPVEEIVASHILTDAVQVSWCSAGQEWVS